MIAKKRVAADVERAASYMTEFRFTTADGHGIVVRADDKFRVSPGSYPSYSARSGLVFRVDAGRETDVRLVVDMISKDVGALLGSTPPLIGKNGVEWNGQFSLNSEQIMATIIKALEEAGIAQEQNKKVTPLRLFIAKLGSKNA